MAEWSRMQPPYELSRRSGFPSDYKVELRHPGYELSDYALFEFNAFNHASGGVRQIFALTACSVVAGNKWHGYFSATIAGPPVQDEILIGACFFFHDHPHAGGQQPCRCVTEPYPIFPTWESWPFPHTDMPPWWPDVGEPSEAMPSVTSDFSQMITARDRSCRVTGSAEACEVAHIIPVEHDAWLMGQKMPSYSHDIKSIDSSGNLILLGRELHFILDRLKWTIFPHGNHWVYYALDRSAELASQFHQRALRPIEGVRCEYLLAAFARAIFPLLNQFLRSTTDKYLVGLEARTDDPLGKKMPGQWCFDTFRPPGHRGRSPSPTESDSSSKSQNPSKRKRNPTTTVGEPEKPHERPDRLSSPRKSKRRRSSGSANMSSYDKEHDASKRWTLEFHHPAFDSPCTCAVLPPSYSTPPSSHADADPVVLRPLQTCLSNQCIVRADMDRLDRLRQEKLAAERLKSGTKGFWEEQVEWAKDPEAVQDVDRWLWVRGQKVFNEDGEHVDTQEGFIPRS
ncbi:MAG: hypothetical protein LQ344_007520 [Seirophora lacunosa]|nr:MAG: hypothetical protein LQ344_007520 [Seirophora lacunosa]